MILSIAMLYTFVIALLILTSAVESTNLTPSQIHIAYAGSSENGYPNGMSVSWSTVDKPLLSLVKYHQVSSTNILEQTGTASKYWETYHSHVILTNLLPSSRYQYQVSSDNQTWSLPQTFQTAADPSSTLEESVNIAIIGDMGVEHSGGVLASLKALVEQNNTDFLLHLGDISYADDAFIHPGDEFKFNYEKVWDQYMEEMSPVTSTLPYMVLPGNHEAECHSTACQFNKNRYQKLANFTAFNTRFRMPSPESNGALNMWYSFNIGPIHFIQIDTETDYPNAPLDAYSWFHPQNGGFGDQLRWLRQDLQQANRSRELRPWIIVSGHRPLYSITNQASSAVNLIKSFESLFQEYGVDIYFCGHIHGYERAFVGPADPLYIVNGAGGSIENHESSSQYNKHKIPAFNQYYNFEEWGYGILNVSYTRFTWSFYSDHGVLLDTISSPSNELIL